MLLRVGLRSEERLYAPDRGAQLLEDSLEEKFHAPPYLSACNLERQGLGKSAMRMPAIA